MLSKEEVKIEDMRVRMDVADVNAIWDRRTNRDWDLSEN